MGPALRWEPKPPPPPPQLCPVANEVAQKFIYLPAPPSGHSTGEPAPRLLSPGNTSRAPRTGATAPPAAPGPPQVAHPGSQGCEPRAAVGSRVCKPLWGPIEPQPLFLSLRSHSAAHPRLTAGWPRWEVGQPRPWLGVPMALPHTLQIGRHSQGLQGPRSSWPLGMRPSTRYVDRVEALTRPTGPRAQGRTHACIPVQCRG